MKNVKHIILHRFPTFPGLTVWKLCCFYFNLIRQAAYSLYGVNFKCIWFTTRDNDSWSHVNRFCHLVIFFHGLRQATFENKSISEYALFNIVQVTIYHSVLIQVMLIPRIFMRDIKCRYFIGKCAEMVENSVKISRAFGFTRALKQIAPFFPRSPSFTKITIKISISIFSSPHLPC